MQLIFHPGAVPGPHIISSSGVEADPHEGRSSTTVASAKLENQTEVKSFAGLASYYRRFVSRVLQRLLAPFINSDG